MNARAKRFLFQTSVASFALFLAIAVITEIGHAQGGDAGMSAGCYPIGMITGQGTIQQDGPLVPVVDLCPGQIVVCTARFSGIDTDYLVDGNLPNENGYCYEPPMAPVCCSYWNCFPGLYECVQFISNANRDFQWSAHGNVIENGLQPDGDHDRTCYAEARAILPTNGETGYLLARRDGCYLPEDSGPNYYTSQFSFEFVDVPTKLLTVCAHQAVQVFSAADKLYDASVNIFLKDDAVGDTLKERYTDTTDKHCCKGIGLSGSVISFNDEDVNPSDDFDFDGDGVPDAVDETTDWYSVITEVTWPIIMGEWSNNNLKKKFVRVFNAISWHPVKGPNDYNGLGSPEGMEIKASAGFGTWAHEYGHAAGLNDLEDEDYIQNFMYFLGVDGRLGVATIQGQDQCAALRQHQ
jgi:hypothetical protein